MKWAKLSKDKDLATMSSQDKLRCFTIYESIAVIPPNGKGPGGREGLFPAKKGGKPNKHIFNKWASYPLGATKFGSRAQKQYELFCGGWLQFYDKQVRDDDTDHTIYFEWDNKKNSVIIWITPPAKKKPNNIYINYLPKVSSIDPPTPPAPPPPPKN